MDAASGDRCKVRTFLFGYTYAMFDSVNAIQQRSDQFEGVFARAQLALQQHTRTMRRAPGVCDRSCAQQPVSAMQSTDGAAHRQFCSGKNAHAPADTPAACVGPVLTVIHTQYTRHEQP